MTGEPISLSNASSSTTLTTLATNSPASKPHSPHISLSTSKNARINRQKHINLDDGREPHSSLDKIKNMILVRSANRSDLFAASKQQQPKSLDVSRPVVSILASTKKYSQVITVPAVSLSNNEANYHKQKSLQLTSNHFLSLSSTSPINKYVNENQTHSLTTSLDNHSPSASIKKIVNQKLSFSNINDTDLISQNKLTTPIAIESLSRKSSFNSVRQVKIFANVLNSLILDFSNSQQG